MQTNLGPNDFPNTADGRIDMLTDSLQQELNLSNNQALSILSHSGKSEIDKNKYITILGTLIMKLSTLTESEKNHFLNSTSYWDSQRKTVVSLIDRPLRELLLGGKHTDIQILIDTYDEMLKRKNAVKKDS
ncbi:hypothetical protein GW846_01305 [Candidatus Gracilibacteria bacterium]|nr:hypothetical protein [Candidatus Gracilibacteria bacterium]